MHWTASEAGNLISSCSEYVYKPSFRCLCCAHSMEYSEWKISDQSRGKVIMTKAPVYIFLIITQLETISKGGNKAATVHRDHLLVTKEKQ